MMTEAKDVSEKSLSPNKIASSERLSDIRLSPDAKRLLYHVKLQYKPGEYGTCAIWTADVGSPDSASQLTSGLFNDHSARFHQDGKRVIFLSDRHKAGGPAQLYSINMRGGEAALLFGKDNKKGISEFEISPDGHYLAFSSADEPSPEDERRAEDKDDARFFGDKRTNNHLRLYSFITGDVRTLDAAKGSHVYHFTWTADSKSVIFLARRCSALEFTEEKVDLQKIHISVGARSKVLVRYSRSPSGLCPLSTGEIVDIQSYEPSRLSDSKSLFFHDEQGSTQRIQPYGEKDDATRIVDLQSGGLFAVEIAEGLDSRIFVHDGRKEGGCLLYETKDEAFEGWDARKLEDGTLVIVAIKSSAVRQEPMNVWTGSTTSLTKTCSLDTRVSSHLQWLKEVPKMHTEPFLWDAKDGTKLDGIIVFPPHDEGEETPKSLPTVLFVHGGPYWRTTLKFAPTYTSWEFLLAAHGYLVISPNYRGGQGHGSEFARAAQNGMGTLDWSDCEDMVDTAIERGLADPSRLGICGWSQGGFMTAWGIGITKKRFKAGVMGAGVSDWGSLAAESDLPEFEADLGGCAPWDTAEPSQRVDLRGSPIGYVSDVETAVLILHGEKDARVPATQGISFFRGLRRRSKYPERHQLVIYPREPHQFTEKNHVEDVMKRVIEHFNLWI